MAKSLDIINPKRELKDEEPESPSRDDDFEMRTPDKNERGGGGVFYLVLGIIAIVVATGAALYILYKDYLPNKKSESVLSTQTPSALASASSQGATATVTSTATSFKYTNEKIRIANGNGISGEGAKVQKELESKEFTVESVGNASKKYTETVVYYKTGQEKLAEALKDAISNLYSATIENSDSVTGNYDAIIALGAK